MSASERTVDGKFLTHRRTIALVGGGAMAAAITTIPRKEKVFNTFCCFQKNEFSSRSRRRRRQRHRWLFTHTHAIMRKLWKLCMEIMRKYIEFYMSLFGSVSTRFDSWCVCLRCLFQFYVISGCVRCALPFATELRRHPNTSFSDACVCETVVYVRIHRTENLVVAHLLLEFYYLNCEICRRKLVECFGDQTFRTQLDMSSVLGSDSHQ